jgi:uncharacterized protein (DUF4415 family)
MRMPTKKPVRSGDWADPDDAPTLTAEMLARAEVFDGDTFVRRGRGRPKSHAAKEQISVRLDADVLAKLREAGPGWQSQINALLRRALGIKEKTPKRAA